MNAYEKASKLLKIRPHHSLELTRKLLLRGFNREAVASIVAQLLSEKLLDDEQFAEVFLDSLIRNKTFGFYGLKAKLMQRGIAGNDAEVLLKKMLSIEMEKQIAQRIVERGTHSAQRQDKIKLAQKLSRKGFRSEVISEVISKK